MPGIIIAGTHSGCGKTTVTLGLLAALKKNGLKVQSFKAGPDFIDTGLHRMITGRPSRNLDLWMCGEDYVKACFHKYSTGVDISVVEGVMGLYDGEYSTARLAEVLQLPIILIVDAYGMAESAGAMVKGFMEYSRAEVRKFGVIFNRVASEGHYERFKNSVKDIQVLGYLPRDLSFEIPHRHLGLLIAEESPISAEKIEKLADEVLKHIDVDTIANLADKSVTQSIGEFRKEHSTTLHNFSNSPRIAIAYDRAFCFYYEDNLDLLREAGAEIVTFSPLSDPTIPENVDAIYIGGGYPELYAEELSENQSILEGIYNWAISGRPMYAECGGLMYLSKGIHDFEGNFFKMAGVFPFEIKMVKGRAHLGYRESRLNSDCILGKKGEIMRGHEFHYSAIEPSSFSPHPSDLIYCYSLFDKKGKELSMEGFSIKNTLASYVHVHFGSNVKIAKKFIEFIIKEQKWKA